MSKHLFLGGPVHGEYLEVGPTGLQHGVAVAGNPTGDDTATHYVSHLLWMSDRHPQIEVYAPAKTMTTELMRLLGEYLAQGPPDGQPQTANTIWDEERHEQ